MRTARLKKRSKGFYHHPIAAACEPLEIRRLLSTVYVDLNAPGPTHDGTSWATAFTDLQPVLTAAVAGTTIDVAEGTYYPTSGTDETATFQLKSGVEIDGRFAGAINPAAPRNVAAYPTILSGDIGVLGNTTANSFHVVTASGTDATAILDGFTITGGDADGTGTAEYGGGFYSSGGTATVNNCTIQTNAAINGGGIYVDSTGLLYHSGPVPTFTNCTLIRNTATTSGGGLYDAMGGSNAVFVNSTFSDNSVGANGLGGAIWIGFNVNAHAYLTLTNCTVSGNSTSGSTGVGGGIYVGVGILNMTATAVTSNTSANDSGGGLYISSSGYGYITNSSFTDNTVILPSTRNGTIGGGGAIYNAGNLTLTNTTFTGNAVAYGDGGAIYQDLTATITGCTFTSNSISTRGLGVRYVGGAVYVDPGAYTQIITDCAFLSNENLQNSGGAVGGSFQLINCDFIGNSAGVGGAISGYSSGAGNSQTNGTAVNCTFTDNSSQDGGAVDGAYALTNCIFWNDSSSLAPEIDNCSRVTYCDVQGGYAGTGNINNNPFFVRPPNPGPDGIWGTADDDYGNLQIDDLSTCIDAGGSAAVPKNATTDLAGNPRIVGAAVDIGAYEFQPQLALATLTFIQQPSSIVAGIPFNSPIIIEAQDSTGAIVPDLAINLSVAQGSATELFGITNELTNSNGYATFTGISHHTAGTYTLQATTGLSAVQSAPFVVAPSQLAGIVFVQQPTKVVTGSAISTAVTVMAMDQFGNAISSDAITLSVNGGATLQGVLTQTSNAGGIATFPSLSIPQAGNFILTATDSSSFTATSAAFFVAPILTFVEQPTVLTAGVVAAPAFVVVALDSTGLPIPGVSITVSGPNQSRLISSGTLTQVTDSAGHATFGDIAIDGAGTFTLEATASPSTAESASIIVNPAAPAQLFEASAQTNVTAGSLFDAYAFIFDAFGNVVPGAVVSASLVNGATQQLFGTLTRTANASGYVVFPDLSLHVAGNVTLQISANQGQLTSDFSIAVTHGQLANLTFLQPPTTLPGHALVSNIMVEAQDAYGNTIAGAQVGIAVASGPAANLYGVLTESTGSNGVATFPDLALRTAGMFTVSATGGGVTSNPSSPFTITMLTGIIVYVDASATGTGDGSTWNNAHTSLQIGLDDALGGDIVEVAHGTYTPPTGTTAFQLIDDVEIDGGFAGAANPLATRNLTAYITNISAVRSNGNASTAILDGFSFTAADALQIDSGDPIIRNCKFIGLQSPLTNEGAAPTLINCLFANDTFIAVSNYNSEPVFINCTFTGNTNFQNTGGIYDSNSSPVLTNCIMWNDESDVSVPAEIFNADSTSIPAVTYSDIEGGYAGVGNINVDPLFVNAAAGNCQLQAGSNCVNVGSNAAVPANLVTDLGGEPRIIDGTVDMGAYECTSTFFTGADDQHSFNDPKNWSGLAVPGAFDNVIIPFGVTVRTAANSGTITLAGLTIQSGGLLDLANNTLVINFTGSDPVATLRGYLQSAYNSGNWTGATGITSSVIQSEVAGAKGTSTGVYSLGYVDGNLDGSVGGAGRNQIIISPQLAADANEDGQVNFLELVTLAQNFGSTNADWVHGDYNYDSIVNFQDLVLLAQNFGKTNGNTLLGAELPVSGFVVMNPVFSETPIEIAPFTDNSDLILEGQSEGVI